MRRPSCGGHLAAAMTHPNSLVGGVDADRCSLSQHQRLQQPLSPRQDRIIGILPLRRSMTCCLHVITGRDYRDTATAPQYDLLRAIRQRTLRYLGHVLRMPESRVVRRALMALTEGGTRYPEGSLLMDCQAYTLHDLQALAQRRATCNNLIHRLL